MFLRNDSGISLGFSGVAAPAAIMSQVRPNEAIMEKSTFDYIIKKNLEAAIGSNAFGYKIPGSPKVYDTYYCNQRFDAFKEEMRASYQGAYDSYFYGKGSELSEQTGRYGVTPPKMASVASSSRFCYLALRDGTHALGGAGNVEFEHECRITGISGIAPQLDAYVEDGGIYVEAKCHEIFDSHRIIMKEKYWQLIYGEGNQFGFQPLPAADSDADQKTFDVPLPAFGIQKSHSMFDTKQFLCHLLGIASQPGGTKRLVYLFFMPIPDDEETQKAIEGVFSELREEIRCIFNSAPIQNFCRANHIALQAVAESSRTMEALSEINMRMLYPLTTCVGTSASRCE